MQSMMERRSEPRVAVDYSVFYYSAGLNAPVTCMLNLSGNGAAVEAANPLPIGSRTSFIFVINGADAVAGGARVIYVLPLADSKYRVGVSFTLLSNRDRELVAAVTQTNV